MILEVILAHGLQKQGANVCAIRYIYSCYILMNHLHVLTHNLEDVIPESPLQTLHMRNEEWRFQVRQS